MARYEINGGNPLNGTVTISGAKNAAVAILPAALLVSGKCRIENVPDISDVRILMGILHRPLDLAKLFSASSTSASSFFRATSASSLVMVAPSSLLVP